MGNRVRVIFGGTALNLWVSAAKSERKKHPHEKRRMWFLYGGKLQQFVGTFLQGHISLGAHWKAKGRNVCEHRDYSNRSSTLPQKTHEEKHKAVLRSQNAQKLGKLNFVFNRETDYLTWQQFGNTEWFPFNNVYFLSTLMRIKESAKEKETTGNNLSSYKPLTLNVPLIAWDS